MKWATTSAKDREAIAIVKEAVELAQDAMEMVPKHYGGHRHWGKYGSAEGWAIANSHKKGK